MKCIRFLFQMASRRITSRDVASIPQPGFNLPDSINFSPDDQLLTYIRSSNLTFMRQLYAYDLRTDREYVYTESDSNSEENLSIEDKFRREVGVFSILFCLRISFFFNF